MNVKWKTCWRSKKKAYDVDVVTIIAIKREKVLHQCVLLWETVWHVSVYLLVNCILLTAGVMTSNSSSGSDTKGLNLDSHPVSEVTSPFLTSLCWFRSGNQMFESDVKPQLVSGCWLLMGSGDRAVWSHDSDCSSCSAEGRLNYRASWLAVNA